MRNIDADILAEFAAKELRPFVLLHFNIDSTDYYYTDCDVPIAYESNLYLPKPFVPSSISYSINNIVDQAQLEIDNNDDALTPVFVGGTPQGSDIDLSLVVLDSSYQIVSVPDELVTNGTFDADSDWSKGTGWTIASGVASCDGTQTDVSSLTQASVFSITGEYVKVTFTVSNYSAGTITPYAGSSGVGNARSADGTFTENIIVAGSLAFALNASADFVGDIDDVSIEQIGKVTLFQGEIGEWNLEEGKISLVMTNQFSRWNQRTLSNHSASCRWKVFKGTECAYAGAYTWCDRSYTRCLTLGNTANFGGFRFLPSIEQAAIVWG